jgi:hypothetical protein
MLVSSPIFDYFFKVAGWKLVGNIPYDLKKTVVIVCPHATWKDFPVGLGARSLMRLPILYWGKKELFEGVFGGICDWRPARAGSGPDRQGGLQAAPTMRRMARPFDVCIRGAGIVGRALALQLAAKRLRVALVDPKAGDLSSGHSDVRA